jgi:hypothetical protein
MTHTPPPRTALDPDAAATRHVPRPTGRRWATTVTGVAVVALLLSGCRGGTTTTTAPGPLPSGSPTASANPQPTLAGDPGTDEGLSDLTDLTGLQDLEATLGSSATGGALTVEEVRRLDQLDTPPGTVTDIALRFLQALAAEDWRAAAAELNLPARFHLSFRSPEQLIAILRDVRRTAVGEQRLTGCDRALRVKSNAVVVTCDDDHRAVVHVQNLSLRGVQISPDHPAGDVVRGPHSHAFSTLMP